MARLANRFPLIAVGVVIAASAWAGLHGSGEWVFTVATMIALAVLIVENQRLKKRLKELDGDVQSKGS